MADTSEIERVLTEAVAAGIPGLTAAAATADGPIFEGAAGRRGLGTDAAMTPDTVFRIASMTKAVTATAAMQLVEQGKIGLDQPAGEILPFLAAPQVLDGFDAAGKPMLRPARGTVTLRNLLTHTSGFVYDNWNGSMHRYMRETGLPGARTGRMAGLSAPLGYDPGTRWEYGIGIDMAGRMVEVVSGQDLDSYMRAHIFAPLGMNDTGYHLRPEMQARLAQLHGRQADGSLAVLDAPPPTYPDFIPGGGGLFSTVRDYLVFLQMLMHGGARNGARILQEETVALMGQNHMGDLDVLPMVSFNPRLSNDVELFPGMRKKWGLSFLINTEQGPAGRSAGSLAWAGLNNTYYWLDPVAKVAGVLMTQILPFGDRAVLDTLDRFETAVYRTVRG